MIFLSGIRWKNKPAKTVKSLAEVVDKVHKAHNFVALTIKFSQLQVSFFLIKFGRFPIGPGFTLQSFFAKIQGQKKDFRFNP